LIQISISKGNIELFSIKIILGILKKGKWMGMGSILGPMAKLIKVNGRLI
jgi:hypothetical protein